MEITNGDNLIKDVEYYFNKVDGEKMKKIKDVLVSDSVFFYGEETRVPFSPSMKRAISGEEYRDNKSKYRLIQPFNYVNYNNIITDIFFIVDVIGEDEFVIARIERSLVEDFTKNNSDKKFEKKYDKEIAILQSYQEFESVERYLHYKDGSITTKKKDKKGVFKKIKTQHFISFKNFEYINVHSELNLDELYKVTKFASQTGFKEYYDIIRNKNILKIISFLEVRFNLNRNSCELIAKSNYNLFKILEEDCSLKSIFAGIGYYDNEGEHVFLRSGNKLKDVIQLPKNIIKFLTNNISRLRYYNLNKLIIGLEDFYKETKQHISLELLELLRDNSRNILSGIDNIRELLTNDSFKLRMKDIYNYLYYTNLNQAIPPNETLDLWKDYLNMSVDMGLSFKKYPKSLKKEHDLVLRDYEYKEEAIIEKSFNKRKEELLKLEYSNDKYSIIIPKSTKELIYEGSELRHCVASYIRDVSNGKTTVLFLRENEFLEKPFVTVELKKNSITQAKEFANKPVTNKEVKQFLDDWLSKIVLS